MTLNQVYNVDNINEVIEILGNFGKDAKIIAGGTDIVIALKNEKISPKVLIDITKIKDLKDIEDEGEYITLGSGVTFAEVVENPLFQGNLQGLYRACRMVGSPQIRHKGTIGGNIANGSAAADSIPPLIALGSMVKLVSIEGEREILLEDYYDDQARDNEIITSIRFKKPRENEILTFAKLGLRKALAISRLTTSVLIGYDHENTIVSIRAASGALGKYPMREIEVENYLLGKKINNETIEGAIESIQNSMDERLKGRSTLPYKRIAVAGILRETLELAAETGSEVSTW